MKKNKADTAPSPSAKKKGALASWGRLFRLYTKVKVPWIFLILTTLCSLLVKEAEVLLVPYTSKIMTGAITEYGFLGGFLCMTLLRAGAELLQETMIDVTAMRARRNARQAVWGKLLRLPMSFYDGRDNQSLVSRITQDTGSVMAAPSVLMQLITVGFGLYTSFKRMYATYKSLALIMLTGIPLTLLSTWVVGKLQYRVSKLENDAVSGNTGYFGERLSGLFHIKTAANEDEEYRRGVEANEERYRMEVKKEGLFILMGPIGSFAQYFNEIILLLAATALVRAGTMKMYHVVNLYNYFMLFMGNAFMITAVWQGLKMSHGGLETLSRIMDAAEEAGAAEGANDAAAETPTGDIVLRDVCFEYDTDPSENGEGGEGAPAPCRVLKGVNMTIPFGKTTALVGLNGSGKSTLIKLLERFREPTAGTVTVGGIPLSSTDPAVWRSRVGYLQQGDQMVPGTIEENIALGVHRSYDRAEAEEAAKKACAYDFIMRKEQGFDTVLSRFDPACSGGEQQRIAAARVIMMKPRYLIMDEATSGLDVQSAAQVYDSLQEVMAEGTVLMVTHDLPMIKRADRVVVLHEGIVEAEGTFEEVSAKSPLFARFLEAAEL